MEDFKFEDVGSLAFGVFVRRRDDKIPSMVKLCGDRIFHVVDDAVQFKRKLTETFGDTFCVYPLRIHAGLTPYTVSEEGSADGKSETCESHASG